MSSVVFTVVLTERPRAAARLRARGRHPRAPAPRRPAPRAAASSVVCPQ